MGLMLNTNIAAMDAYRNLSNTQSSMQSSLEKLSSGFRINKAADDAAGLSISEGLTSQINGLTQAGQNAQDGINVVQTADGALNETQSILQRMRTLAVQSANGGAMDSTAQGAADSEFQQLKTELDNIAKSTNFNGQALLDGTYTGKFQVGANNVASDQTTVTLATAMTSTGLALNGATVAVDTTAHAQTAINTIDTAIATVSNTRSTLGAYQNSFQHTVNNINVAVQNLSASESAIKDTDMAKEMVNFTKNQILSQAGTAMLAQANQAPQSILKLLQ